ncbi:MAG: S-methyl-5'-thioadenosine phosphorylase [Dehalococcoidia bacterium]|nr:S-methyl-5'-thioadenosine phosphorylase [Dehalococcoidia bacterium]
MPDTARIGIIGGSGLYDLEGLTDVRQVRPHTPYGPPSDAIVLGELQGVAVAFLPRHGVGHRLSPSELPARANIFALKLLGVERLISVSAVGSLQERIRPLHLVLPDQLIDRTRGRPSTFFEGGIVAHVAFAEPFCAELRSLLHQGAQASGARSHLGGTMVVMEGPQFSTKAESHLYRSWGASVIGMTALPEAKLAREAEMCYATLACATDYDCWHESEEPVSVELVVQNLLSNVAVSQEVLRRAIPHLPASRTCPCASALKNAIITAPAAIPVDVKRRLAPLIGKYLP